MKKGWNKPELMILDISFTKGNLVPWNDERQAIATDGTIQYALEIGDMDAYNKRIEEIKEYAGGAS